MSPARQLDGLTALRGLSALWVVAFHLRHVLGPLVPEVAADLAGCGYLGVDLFFVLSGFVLAHAYGDRIESARAYAAHVVRRFGRIWPLHALTLAALLVVVLAAPRLGPSGLDVSPYYPLDRELVFNALMLHGWGLSPHETWNIPSWSVSVEWLAYLAFPLLAWPAMQVRSRFGAAFGAAASCAALVLVLVALGDASLHAPLPHRLARGLFEVASGTFVYRWWAARDPAAPVWPLAAGAAGLGLWCLLGWTDWPWPFACALTVYAFARARASTPAPGPLHRLGAISYAVYLLHLPLLKLGLRLWPGTPGWLFVAVFLGGLVAASELSYRAVESPAREWFRRLADRIEKAAC